MPRAACGQEFKEGPNRRSADPPADPSADPPADPSADFAADPSADPPADPSADPPSADQESGKVPRKYSSKKLMRALHWRPPKNSQFMGCSMFILCSFILYVHFVHPPPPHPPLRRREEHFLNL
jgi:hypothetical protein